MIGLCGAHRSGKSTLGKALAEQLGLPFYAISAGGIARDLGFDAIKPMSFEERVKVQVAILGRFGEILAELPAAAVVDRTPIDYAAYLLGEVTMNTDVGAHDKHVVDYVELAMTMTNTRFTWVGHVSPLEGYAAEEGKPGASRAYQKLIDILIAGMLPDVEGPAISFIPAASLEDRVLGTAGALKDYLGKRAEDGLLAAPACFH